MKPSLSFVTDYGEAVYLAQERYQQRLCVLQTDVKARLYAYRC